MDQIEQGDLRYDKWIEEALRGVIRRALTHAATEGLPGEHHFYITHRTDHPDVIMPSYLKAQHPEEITIVIQHQFDELEVDRAGFSVILRFGGKPERLYVPFSAVTAFADPSVNFGLQLKVMELTDEEMAELDDLDLEDDDPFPHEADQDNDDDALDDEEPKTGEVIALDSFRKKS